MEKDQNDRQHLRDSAQHEARTGVAQAAGGAGSRLLHYCECWHAGELARRLEHTKICGQATVGSLRCAAAGALCQI